MSKMMTTIASDNVLSCSEQKNTTIIQFFHVNPFNSNFYIAVKYQSLKSALRFVIRKIPLSR